VKLAEAPVLPDWLGRTGAWEDPELIECPAAGSMLAGVRSRMLSRSGLARREAEGDVEEPRLLSEARPITPPSAGPATLAVVPTTVKLWVVLRFGVPLESVTAAPRSSRYRAGVRDEELARVDIEAIRLSPSAVTGRFRTGGPLMPCPPRVSVLAAGAAPIV
jgi:hypothetical protein